MRICITILLFWFAIKFLAYCKRPPIHINLSGGGYLQLNLCELHNVFKGFLKCIEIHLKRPICFERFSLTYNVVLICHFFAWIPESFEFVAEQITKRLPFIHFYVLKNYRITKLKSFFPFSFIYLKRDFLSIQCHSGERTKNPFRASVNATY